LVEAIVEIRWAPKPEGDPSYPLLVGRLSEALREEYPAYEPAPHADLPATMAAQMYLVQHRLRARKEGWPLVQVGPNVFTINETEAYDWEGDFRGRVIDAVQAYYKARPEARDMRPQSILLRYIDAIEVEWTQESILEFMKKELKTGIELPPALFEGTGVDQLPAGLDFRVSFRTHSPRGMAHLRFASGQSHDKDALILETMVQSADEDVPELPGAFAGWLEEAHRIPSTWFERLTEGNLYRRFQGG
jgi:uncharacterized protein (TIGR04255 family)